MHVGTFERTTPSFFRHGPSALSRLVLLGALSIFLMVADARLHIVQPLRTAIATVLYPLQLIVVQPLTWYRQVTHYVDSLDHAQREARSARDQLHAQTLRAARVEQLELENDRLRRLLVLREYVKPTGQAAQVLYDAADPYTRKVVIDRGQLHHVLAGSPVLDENGVLGQVTMVYPSVSEVTLLTDADQAIPLLNARNGVRAIAYGAQGEEAGLIELRYLPANTDIEEGDLLTTSGVDGVYPPGLPVARVERVRRRVDSAFAIVYCKPVANASGAMHVLVVQPVAEGSADAMPKEPARAADKKERRK